MFWGNTLEKGLPHSPNVSAATKSTVTLSTASDQGWNFQKLSHVGEKIRIQIT